MTNETLEQRIRTAIEHAAPDVLEQILASCPEQSRSVTPFPPSRKPKKHRRILATAAALFLVCAGAFGWGTWQTANAADSIVMLDVNPSVSLTINVKERVISAEALNADAQIILGDMDLKGADLEVAVNALIGSMLQHGYLDDLQNSILVSVEHKDPARSAQLQQEICQTISGMFQNDQLEASVLTQSVSEDDALLALAQQYAISIGKAALIQEVVAQDPTLTFASLAPLSVNEIALIADSRHLTTETVTQTGSASTKAYITPAEAQNIALTHAGVSAQDASRLELEFDSEDGVMVYEVEFYAGTTEYDYDIDARTGSVVKFSHENYGGRDTQANDSGTTVTAVLTEAEAKAIAFASAGVSEDTLSHINVKLDFDHGSLRYEIAFRSASTQYEYEIDANSGSILDVETEIDNAPSPNHSYHTSDSYIGEAAAKAAALAHAGVAEFELSKWEIELDFDDGHAIYEIEFKTSSMEYEYEIDANSGAVLKAEQDYDD